MFNTIAEKKKYTSWELAKEKKQINIKKAQEARKANIQKKKEEALITPIQEEEKLPIPKGKEKSSQRDNCINDSSLWDEESPPKKQTSKGKINIKDLIYNDWSEEWEREYKKKKRNESQGKNIFNMLNNIHAKIEQQQKKVDKLYYMKKNKIPTKKEEQPIIIHNNIPQKEQNENPILDAIRNKIIKNQ